ncbi:arylesterase [Pedobacter sp. CFBP9032]|uniref:arylesterase n=1 Tax=Pedobacter sp. CFBP9032 TaxID=3096539 RepID=UPI002A6A902E|nr:arylesterase [Pedobacter sp. CFBP9032]MDY0907480.1 arylesterase [Pedobacter sp. CFBP9032]
MMMKQIIFFGDSLTQGYGLRDPAKAAFPALIQKRLDEVGNGFNVINAGLSGDTTFSALNRLKSVLKMQTDIFVLELGANDLIRGHSASDVEANLQHMIDLVKHDHPSAPILLLGMELPEWIPGAKAAGYRNIYTRLADKNQIHLVPFLLEGVAGIPHLNMFDGIHPLAEGYEIIAKNVWKTLKVVMETMQ